MKAVTLSTWKRLGAMTAIASLLTAFVFLFLLPQDTQASPRQDVAEITASTVWRESFETDGVGTRYTVTEQCTDGGGDYFTRTNGTNIGSYIEISNVDGSYFYAAMDTDGSPCTLVTQVITFSAINIADSGALQFSGMFAEDDSSDGDEDWDDTSYVYVEYNIDGSGWTKVMQFASEAAGSNSEPRQDTNFDGTGDGNALTPALTNFIADIAGNGSSLELRLTIDGLRYGDEDIAFDDLRLISTSPSFEIEKSAPAIVAPGELFTYTIAITNSTSITTTGTVITDVVPMNATFASASDGGVESGGVVSWIVAGDFVADTSLERTFVVTATSSNGVNIVNDDYGVMATNWVTMATGSPVTSTVSPLDLSITKTGPAYGVISDTVVYTVVLDNQGVANADDVIVTDTLPISTTIVSSDMGMAINPTSGVYVWNLGTILSGTMETYHITVTVDADVASGTMLINTIMATTSTVGDELSNNMDMWETAVYPLVSIYDVQYVITPTNASDYDAQTVWVEGVVTAQTGELDNSMAVIQDPAGGAWTGLPLYLSGMPTIAEGDYVRALGVVDEQYGLTQLELLDADAVEQLGTMPIPAPAVINTGDYASEATAEQWEAVYLQFDNATVSSLLNYGEWTFDDGSGDATADDMGELNSALTYQPTVGDAYNYIRGIGWYSFSAYKLQPRYDADIAFDPSIVKTAAGLVDPGALYTYTLTVDNRVGYDLTNIIITDTLPISSTFAYASDGGVVTSGVVSWTVPTAGNWTTVERTFAVTATTVIAAEIVNSDYGFQADNWMTFTMGSPITTTVSANACGETYTSIYDIQGNGPSSPVDGDAVFTEGVVTAVYQGTDQLNGFYIQDETGDNDVATSDGIFVYSSMNAVAGDVVRVAGTVDEHFDLTQITSVSSILVCGTGTITPTNVTLPVATLDIWEQYEGMLLDFPQGLYATETYVLGRYGEVSLSVNDRLYNPTNITTPGAAAIAQQDLNDRSRIQLDDTYTNQNRDPIAYPGAGLMYTNTLRGGDYVANLTGVLDYAFGAYKIQPVGAVDFVATNTRTAAPEDVGGNLTVASFNVLNYFNGDGQGGGFPTPRGAHTATEFNRQRVKIINAIVAIDADIIGLMEIENDGYESFSAIQDLVNGLNDATITGTYAFVDPGVSTIGTDQIAVGLLYKPANVTLAGAPQILDSTVITTFNDLKNRPVLAQSFTETVSGKVVTVAVNHLKSKGSDCDADGDPDTGDGQGNCNLTRESAAEALVTWLATDPTSSGSAYSLIIGDLNSYAMEDPITAITEAGYTNLLSEFGGMYAYSYVFGGQHGYLDHALASAELMPFVTGASTWHINSDEPISLDYNEEFKTANQLITLYGEGPYRASDHDPVIIGLQFMYKTYLPIIMK